MASTAFKSSVLVLAGVFDDEGILTKHTRHMCRFSVEKNRGSVCIFFLCVRVCIMHAIACPVASIAFKSSLLALAGVFDDECDLLNVYNVRE